jgi:hypothetical protein
VPICYVVNVTEALSQPNEDTDMTTITIKANKTLTTEVAVRGYIDQLIDETPELSHYRYALVDVVNTENDDTIELHSEPDMEGDFVSSTNGVHMLWMPEINRAALNCWQGGDWQWTDATSHEDAFRRFREDDMST